jgi:hypothetical protein
MIKFILDRQNGGITDWNEPVRDREWRRILLNESINLWIL